MNHIFKPMLWPLTRWARHSQREAHRNAVVASTALRARRRDRDEVQEYCEVLIARRRHHTGAASGSSAAQPRVG